MVVDRAVPGRGRIAGREAGLDVFWEAVKLKATFPMSYADCFTAALAMTLKAVVLTSDPELEVLGDAVPRIRI